VNRGLRCSKCETRTQSISSARSADAEVVDVVVAATDRHRSRLDEKNAATVTIKYADARRGQVVLDVNASEVDDLAVKGTKQARRGRKPKASG
jgi:hypothetical protein